MTFISILVPVIVALITSLIGPIIVDFFHKKFEKKPAETPVVEAININLLVDHQLENIMVELECDRVWLAQFHNGGHFYPTGKSIQKFSVFYEKLTIGTPSIQGMLKNIPVSLFPKTLSKMNEDGELEIPSIKNADELYGLESISHPLGTKSLCMVGIYSIDDHLIGVMGLAYNRTEHTLVHDEWVFLRQKIGVIGTLLTEYLYTPGKKQ